MERQFLAVQRIGTARSALIDEEHVVCLADVRELVHELAREIGRRVARAAHQFDPWIVGGCTMHRGDDDNA